MSDAVEKICHVSTSSVSNNTTRFLTPNNNNDNNTEDNQCCTASAISISTVTSRCESLCDYNYTNRNYSDSIDSNSNNHRLSKRVGRNDDAREAEEVPASIITRAEEEVEEF